MKDKYMHPVFTVLHAISFIVIGTMAALHAIAVGHHIKKWRE